MQKMAFSPDEFYLKLRMSFECFGYFFPLVEHQAADFFFHLLVLDKCHFLQYSFLDIACIFIALSQTVCVFDSVNEEMLEVTELLVSQ